MALLKRSIITGVAALLFSSWVCALGLGEIKLNSALNEPLDAEIPLINLAGMSEAELIVELASASDFENAGVERSVDLLALIFALDLEAAGGPVVRVSSKKPIREPYLDFLLDLQWTSGRLLREYTVLLDLPLYVGGTAEKKTLGFPSQASLAHLNDL